MCEPCWLTGFPVGDNVRSIKMTIPNSQRRTTRAALRQPMGRQSTRPRRGKPGQQGFVFRTWGGRREGAGRHPKDGVRSGVSHRPRPELSRRLPIHVTLRMAPHVYNLRSRRSFRVIAAALRAAADRFAVQIVRFSVQGNHLHLLVEAQSRADLGRAMKGLSVRLAKGLNRMMGKTGPVLGDRYHAHVLRTPTEVKRAMRYIADNARRHAASRGDVYSAGYVDPYSSDSPTTNDVVLPVPRTWLLKEGWRRGTG
jgi:REP element-mobilizing transposase RayT